MAGQVGMLRTTALGRFLDVSTSARRPAALDELRAYRIGARLPGASVLDIGTGDGRLAFGAAEAGAREVVGVDPDQAAIRAARRRARALGRANVSFRVGAAQDLPVASGAFDVALLSWAL